MTVTEDWCTCWSRRGYDDAIDIPIVAVDEPCGDDGPHRHRCHRPDGHHGRHHELLDQGVVMAVWS